jgi:osmoprotectant transport system permease protein
LPPASILQVDPVASAGPLVQWAWVSSNEGAILSLLGQHVELTAIAVAVGFAIALPLGVAAWRFRPLRSPLIGAAGMLYVVPSIALLSLVAPLTGFFSITTAEVALVSYTLLILLRNTVAGLDAVPPEVHEAARSMGYSAFQQLLRVQLPIAFPSVLAGVRVATVTVVGLVNVTALLGQGGLGQLIIQGFTEDFNTPIVVGLVLSVLLAGVADAILVVAERVSLPWARSRGAKAK